MSRKYDDQWKRRVTSRNAPAKPAPEFRTGVRPVGQPRPPTVDELDALAVRAAGEAGRLARDVESLLRTEGPADPREWTQRELRAQVGAFMREGLRPEAAAVERYADARLAWSNAIAAYQRAADPRRPQAARPKELHPSAESKARKAKKRPQADPAGTRSVGWVGRKVMPPAEPWHATVPPWEDGPEGSRVEW